MAKRTISGGFETYRRASDGATAFGMQGDEVDVHQDDIERFDRLHPVSIEPVELTDGDDEVELPEGKPTTDWTGKQLDKYAADNAIDISAAKNKADKVATIEAVEAE